MNVKNFLLRVVFRGLVELEISRFLFAMMRYYIKSRDQRIMQLCVWWPMNHVKIEVKLSLHVTQLLCHVTIVGGFFFS